MITSLDLKLEIFKHAVLRHKSSFTKAQGLTDGLPKTSILSLGTMLTRTTKLVR